MPDGSTELNWRYWIVPSDFLSRSLFSSHSVDGSSLTDVAPTAKLPAAAGEVRLPSWNLQSAVANTSAFRVLVPSVLRSISSANELPSSCARRFMPGVRAR